MHLLRTEIKLYKKGYASQLIRGVDGEARPWNLQTLLLQRVQPDSIVLDLGSGTCEKLINLARKTKQIFALEPSQEMRDIAQQIIINNGIENICLVEGVSDRLPFSKEYFDVVTCMLAPWHVDELYRVLKPDGKVIIEAIGYLDKENFKQEAGKDKRGWRGMFMEYTEEQFTEKINDDLNRKFKNVNIRKGFWDTYYSREGMIQLLENTPTIRDFDKDKDIAIINAIESKYSTSIGIKTTQNRLLITADKK